MRTSVSYNFVRCAFTPLKILGNLLFEIRSVCCYPIVFAFSEFSFIWMFVRHFKLLGDPVWYLFSSSYNCCSSGCSPSNFVNNFTFCSGKAYQTRYSKLLVFLIYLFKFQGSVWWNLIVAWGQLQGIRDDLKFLRRCMMCTCSRRLGSLKSDSQITCFTD